MSSAVSLILPAPDCGLRLAFLLEKKKSRQRINRGEE
jgi:hypothetical protein